MLLPLKQSEGDSWRPCPQGKEFFLVADPPLPNHPHHCPAQRHPQNQLKIPKHETELDMSSFCKEGGLGRVVEGRLLQ
eukprot:1323434-Amphidinium_carterae.1